MEEKDLSNSKSALEMAEEYGLDITLIYENLRLSPTERLEQLRKLVEFSDAIAASSAKKNTE